MYYMIIVIMISQSIHTCPSSPFCLLFHNKTNHILKKLQYGNSLIFTATNTGTPTKSSVFEVVLVKFNKFI